MKGRYGGRMTIYGTILPRAALVARLAVVTPAARKRLKILDWHQTHGQNISLTARRFGIQRLTLRRWIKRSGTSGIEALNDRSHRPHRLRQPVTPWEVVNEVVRLRRQYPAWSKHKIYPLLAAGGFKTSVSTVGRILKRKGLINPKVSRKRQRAARRPKARFPKGLRISRPGDMVQLDTKHVMLPQGRKHYQFTAIDVLTKQRVLEIYPSEASVNGANFLAACRQEFPFKVRAVQTDNGAPFQKEFERLCQKLKLPHYYIYPHTPKQNTYVEISHGADKREFYLQGNAWQDRQVMRAKLKEWQSVWNEIRPHEALGYLTPKAYFLKWQNSRLPTKDTITLQT
ncbi:MAG: IS481 family transposase [Patescibacteria group bacterium]